MSGWIWRGVRGGKLTVEYPRERVWMPQSYRGTVRALASSPQEQERGAAVCPTRAIQIGETRAIVDLERCIQCGLCASSSPAAFELRPEFAIARLAPEPARSRARRAAAAFGRSVHLRHVDTGSDGSEEQELQAIFNPFYDANRLGIFLTATPRHADMLVVTGPVTQAMLDPLRRTYEAMPQPNLVVALGTSACSAGMFAEAPIAGPVDRVLPVDLYVPGSPPAPLTILHGLLLALGRAPAEHLQ